MESIAMEPTIRWNLDESTMERQMMMALVYGRLPTPVYELQDPMQASWHPSHSRWVFLIQRPMLAYGHRH
jgi:hypothetical protein